MESEAGEIKEESENETSKTISNVQPTTESSFLYHREISDDEPEAQSTFSAVIAAQPSFRKLFLSEASFPQNFKSYFARSRVLNSPFRWSRNKSSSYPNQMPTLIQINAGRRVLQKYRKFARNLEYKRLHSIIPSLSKRKYASKARIIHEAIQYIDTLHQQLVDSIRTKGLPPILQKMKSNLLVPKSTSNDNSQDNQVETGLKKTQLNKTEDSASNLTGISSNDTISLIQSALRPEIEKRLEARRKMDRLAMEALIQFSDSHPSTNQVEKVPLGTNQHESSPDKIKEESQKKFQ